MNIDPDARAASGRAVSLDLAALHVEHAFGPAWYYNPARWPTRDGYAPLRHVWAAWLALECGWAIDRLNIVRAISITKAGDRMQSMIADLLDEALGG